MQYEQISKDKRIDLTKAICRYWYGLERIAALLTGNT